MSRLVDIICLLALLGLLLGIRWFQNELFYDPLISFFETDHTQQKAPELDSFKLMLHLFLRFLLNSIISIGVLWVLFKNLNFVKVSILLYLLLFVVLGTIFYVMLFPLESTNYMSLFYLRRFLIQPILLLVLIPAFYFQKKNTV